MWRDLNTPDDFRDDWYGELTNQCAHTWIGAVASVLAVNLYLACAGDLPVRSHVFLIVFLPYAVGIEWIVQKWLPGDAWFDAIMFAFGSAAVLVPFSETMVHGQVDLRYSAVHMNAVLFLWAAFLAPRVWKRWRSAKRARQNAGISERVPGGAGGSGHRVRNHEGERGGNG